MTTTQLLDRLLGRAQNGHAAARRAPGEGSKRTAPPAIAAAETAQCNCPEFCERDHANE
jgi:hypothetical protein